MPFMYTFKHDLIMIIFSIDIRYNRIIVCDIHFEH